MTNYIAESVAKGYVYECDCGEGHKTIAGAFGCRKCRTYLLDDDFYNRKVVDLRTGKPVQREGW